MGNHFVPQGSEVKYAMNAASALGCSEALDEDTLVCMQNVDMVERLKDVSDSDEAQFDPSISIKFLFWPVVDSYAANPFLPMDPLEALKSGMFNRIPYMSGTCTYEGALDIGAYGFAGITGDATLDLIEVPPKMGFYLNYGQEPTFGKVARMFYNHPTGESRFEQEKPAMNFFTDSAFLSSDQKSVHLMSGYVKNVYNYHFSQPTNNSLLAGGFNLSIEYTPTHADDLIFLVSLDAFSKIYPDLIKGFSEDETSTSKHMIKYWTNFAKYGDPSGYEKDAHEPEWYPVSQNEKNYMDLNANPEMKEDLFSERVLFWDKMIWQEAERMVEKKILYEKATQFLINGYKI